jgi:tRNA nucleotidyltransferase/poly(A) polymerase
MLFHAPHATSTKGEHMGTTDALQEGQMADMEGAPCPPPIARWLASLPDDLLRLLQTLAEAGEGAWLVGGCVRDAWLGETAPDIDVCTTCTPDRMMELFGEQAIPTGIDFGTITVKGQGQHYEVTTLRTESLYRDGRRPDVVSWGRSLKEDLSRRDFTFNSMAVDVARRRLYDPYNGLADLQQRLVRAVGDAGQRCEEDALRILRAYRFRRRDSGPLWAMDAELEQAIARHATRLGMVAIERRWMEVKKILAGPKPGAVLGAMQDGGVLRHVFEHLIVMNTALLNVLDDDRLQRLHLHHRLALMMVEHPTKEAVQQRNRLRASNELQRSTAAFHEVLGHLPTSHTAALRVFSHALTTQAEPHLLTLECLAEHGIQVHTGLRLETAAVAEVKKRWYTVGPRSEPVPCLVDGHWLMERTNLGQGIRLGRLKQWLHRRQIEEEVTTIEGMEALLVRTPYEHGAAEDWPTPSFP